MSTITGLKLINGEEIIGNVASTITDKYYIERPMAIITQKAGAQLSLSLVPWIISAGPGAIIPVSTSAVAAPFIPIPEIEREYISQTTGIQMIGG